ncbi:hypothetical protein A3D84_00210 [Candidatus Woesebacteria bacterium RIFCSPHIGHO2_02_FULL_42_20]|uniref:Peptidase M23 domain-containing protein n=1 Tax=Candidatus Woesebacteria bacterium RIFCSPHIGHO2_12_FULL_41_24 TaxID=1802510 RepID=A0A1F8ATN5_9BACT|nr:MAG: hypothetical protein A2W15_01710 [Candidatus Woesebacteria bacterium RBG_16_41_13]OGM29674.1 MAG: hypothetical protein A2873_02130 [Candidatus Woesebacteria bacterium RIFCSPHIGHO2_01_FULL_42_80]OGM35203.1 MAG: hypothetical protein A3D84_00210 [Candidatus Woesebacteria bacterium RIFCSPHIGHO2_02_FULL_42_20]OGM55096.1 MAG: hypothetical protein A3E44_04215 [Candidatus Woesebacteria bacterium RIFCSPHIGHO2_12_FULL_41_24]OGM67669.1 MAG: hypothetical protein A2969_01920 [Candidatus Woesebacteri
MLRNLIVMAMALEVYQMTSKFFSSKLRAKSCIVGLMLQKALPAGRRGFGSILLIVIILGAFALGFFLLKSVAKYSSRNYGSQQVLNPDEPPLKLKTIGVNFEDFKFTKQKLQFDRLFMEYGFVIPAGNSSTGQDKPNPQPTFVVPLGTSIRSIVDGIVVAIPTLWSGDFSVQVTQDGKMQKWIYEMEHVINPKVKVGEKVTAGQVVGEVSDFNHGAPVGFGATEIGILKGGQAPEHVCPFAYLDDSIREETFTNLGNLLKAWEEYIGDQKLYDESLTIPGCLTLNPIEG